MGLTARQWGAEEVVFCGEKDESMIESQRDIIERWGGDTKVRYEESWKKEIKEFKGLIVHLTMYGERIDNKMDEIEEKLGGDEDLLVIVGAEKVPRWVYTQVDYNISVGNQPHSEIAALAVFLDRLHGLETEFPDADIVVQPSEDRKLTEKKKEE